MVNNDVLKLIQEYNINIKILEKNIKSLKIKENISNFEGIIKNINESNKIFNKNEILRNKILELLNNNTSVFILYKNLGICIDEENYEEAVKIKKEIQNYNEYSKTI